MRARPPASRPGLSRLAAAAALLAMAAPAHAQTGRDYAPSRPGLGTPASTIESGRVSVETGFAQWEQDDQAGVRTDTVDVGDTTVRLGISDTAELLASWTPFEHVRLRNRASGTIDRARGVGDVTLGIKQNLRHPDGSGLSLAVLPFVTLPVGSARVGAGDWGAGLVVPVSYDLSDTLSLQFTPEVDAATDSDGSGRHLACRAIVGIGVELTKALSVTGELAGLRDRDPDGRTTQTLASVALAWMARDDLQLDVGGTAGLNRVTPDHTLYAGISRRF